MKYLICLLCTLVLIMGVCIYNLTKRVNDLAINQSLQSRSLSLNTKTLLLEGRMIAEIVDIVVPIAVKKEIELKRLVRYRNGVKNGRNEFAKQILYRTDYKTD